MTQLRRNRLALRPHRTRPIPPPNHNTIQVNKRPIRRQPHLNRHHNHNRHILRTSHIHNRTNRNLSHNSQHHNTNRHLPVNRRNGIITTSLTRRTNARKTNRKMLQDPNDSTISRVRHFSMTTTNPRNRTIRPLHVSLKPPLGAL